MSSSRLSDRRIRSQNARANTVRQNARPPTLTRAHLQGFVVGFLVGVVVCVSVASWLDKSTSSIPPDSIPTPKVEVSKEPRFDFYTLLPKQKLVLSPEIGTSNVQVGSMIAKQYILQAGSFRQEKDADRRRGEIALLGIEASIQISDNVDDPWYRVHLGPFLNDSELSRARALTSQAGIDTMLLRREGL